MSEKEINEKRVALTHLEDDIDSMKLLTEHQKKVAVRTLLEILGRYPKGDEIEKEIGYFVVSAAKYEIEQKNLEG